MRIARYLTPALLLALVPTVGFTNQSPQDPSSRVGRLSFLSGAVSLRPGGADDWTDATINYPLTAGDELWADADARTEITMGSTAVRLASNTAFGFLALDDQTTQIRLSEGSLQVRVRDLASDETFEVDTPNGAVSLLRPGAYRIDVTSTGDETRLTVRQGEAELTAAGSAFSVNGGQTATVSGIDSPTYDIQGASQPDDWEQWAGVRDRRRDQSHSAQYVSRDMPGYEDLDDYGDWRQTADYGAVWTPRGVVAGWAPYRDGRWVWVDPWGWTWVDDAPWGFAPFHYGRWAYIGGGWGWVPGHAVVRSVYSPALVAFVGGANWSVTVGAGGGGVGWFPLAPGEMYVPAYHVSQGYVRNINITNVNVTVINLGNVTNVNYRNREAPGGVTVVARETFVGARPVGRGLLVVPLDRLSAAPVVGAAPYAPTRESVLPPVGRPARQPPAVAVTRRVVVRNTPPPPAVPFTVREKALQTNPGRPLDPAAVANLRERGAGADVNQRVRPATGGGGAALKPARGGLPEPRAATPAGAKREPERAAPAVVPAPPAERPAPVVQPPARRVPAERPAPPPAEQPAPVVQPPARRVPAERPAPPPAERPAPAQQPPARRVPVERPAPPPERRAPAQQPPARRVPAERTAPPTAQPPQPAAAGKPATPAEREQPARPPARGREKKDTADTKGQQRP
jgi:hypothetical protein